MRTILLMLLVCGFSASLQATAPNIVMIISDDHAWTDYSFMGHPHIKTPNLDKLASQSLTFRRGYVPSSLCCPSLASIITGRYPHQHKITSNDPPRPPGMSQAQFHKSDAFLQGREKMNRQMDSVPTLPRILSQEGYLSLQTGKWWQGDFKRGGFTHGMTKGGRHGDDGLKIGRQTMQPIFDFIQEARGQNKPFFVWYAPLLPHDPHNPPQRLLDKYKDKTESIHIARYWAMVEWFDETCGQLMDHLDKENLATNTIVVYLTDNGWIQNATTNRYALRSKQSPYDGGLRTPIMIRWPGKIQPKLSDELASSIDLMPTLLKAVGARLPRGLEGINLLDAKALGKREAIFGECFSHDSEDLDEPAKSLRWRWVIRDQWKLIMPKDKSEPVELYNVLQDPHESTNVASGNARLVKSLTRQLDKWWKP